jgi:superfamily II DNA or RNA helicase
MKLTLPPLYGISETNEKNLIRQLLLPSSEVEAEAIPFTRGKYRGFMLTVLSGGPPLLVFTKQPTGMTMEPNDYVIVAPRFSLSNEVAVLENSATWWAHPDLPVLVRARNASASEALTSWRECFHFVEENPERGVIGLRKPQIGALHAIHAHWSVDGSIATIVMPTGTGKTETMLSVLVSAPCRRVLVVVPTDALRTQIAEKFITLGILKLPGSQVVAPSAKRPVVGVLRSKPKTADSVTELFERCNVIISTSQIVGQCAPDVQVRISEMCTELFIDEAHHVEAPTWKNFKTYFSKHRVLQFTATPFREDAQLIDGRIVYSYPLRLAQQEGYFRPIRFVPVVEFDPTRADEQIAARAVQELEQDATGKHIVMARVARIERATSVFALYRAIGKFNPVVLHTGLTAAERAKAREELIGGTSRIVVCVDMLGEGFDMPELKIAAFHDIRKSLAVTLQLAGRFTRSRPDLGDPIFIANTADLDVQEELRRLYTQDPDWNALLPAISEAAIESQREAQEFFHGFDHFPPELPIQNLRPAASTVIYRTSCTNWTPHRFKTGIRGQYRQIHHALNQRENTLVIVAGSEQPVAWADLPNIRDWMLELYVAVWDRETELLFIHGSSNSGEFKELAKALCGSDVTLVVDPDVYRCFHGVNRLLLTNVGLNEHFGRQIRYTGRMGADVASRLSETTRQTARKAVLAGSGFEGGSSVSFGAAKRGRVWSHLRLRVDTFAKWCRSVGRKVVDESIDPEEVLRGTLIPELISTLPSVACICIDWPSQVYGNFESATKFVWGGGRTAFVTEVSIELVDRIDSSELQFRVWGEDLMNVRFRLRLTALEDGRNDYCIEYVSGGPIEVVHAGTRDACEFFEQNPPVIWFEDGSSLEGCTHIALPRRLPSFDASRLVAWNWTGIDISKESQGLTRRSDAVQFRTIQALRSDARPYNLIFDDDGSGEAADVVAVRLFENGASLIVEVEFYHCKFSVGTPGARIDDLYVLCGQAQRSIGWLHNKDRKTDLFTHLLRREATRVDSGRPSRLEIGTKETILELREQSRRHEVRLKVFIVQPGLSKAVASLEQMRLLGVTEQFLLETYEVPFGIICSD